MKKLLILAFSMFVFAVSSISQEAGYKDLAEVELREAKAPIGGGSGSCGFSSHEPAPTTPLNITLISVDQTRYVMGDDVESVVKLTNVGKGPVLLPGIRTRPISKRKPSMATIATLVSPCSWNYLMAGGRGRN